MKNILFVAFLFFLSNFLFSQTYEIDTYANQTVSTCSGTFYDSGGQNGDYSPSEGYIITICPATAGMKLSVNFISFNVTAGCQLYVFNGTNTAATLLTMFDENLSPVGIQIAATASNTVTIAASVPETLAIPLTILNVPAASLIINIANNKAKLPTVLNA